MPCGISKTLAMLDGVASVLGGMGHDRLEPLGLPAGWAEGRREGGTRRNLPWLGLLRQNAREWAND